MIARLRAILFASIAFTFVFGVGSKIDAWRIPPWAWWRDLGRTGDFWEWLSTLNRKSPPGGFRYWHSKNIRNSALLFGISLGLGLLAYRLARPRSQDESVSDYKDGQHGLIQDGHTEGTSSNHETTI